MHSSGKPVVEQLAFLVKDVDAWAEKLDAADTDLFVHFTLKGIGLTADLAYMDKNEEDGLGAYPHEFDNPSGTQQTTDSYRSYLSRAHSNARIARDQALPINKRRPRKVCPSMDDGCNRMH